MTQFNLTIDINAAYKWGVTDGVRDLIQNMLDQGDYDWNYSNRTLTLTNYGVSLDRGYFLQGKSTKRDDPTSRGQYGEGSTLAIAVLLREGLDITIINDEVLWVPEVTYDTNFNSDVISITEEEPETRTNNFSIEVDGIDESTWEEVLLNTLPFQDDIGEVFEGEDCTLLLDEKWHGRVYCGGLFVCEMVEFGAGYDFKPEALPLNRDRAEVDSWTLQYRTKDLWSQYAEYQAKTENIEVLKEMATSLADNSRQELTHLRYADNIPEELLDEVFDVYEDRYEGKEVVDCYSDKERLEKRGIKAEIAPTAFVEVLKKSSKYQEIDFRGNEGEKSLEEKLDDFRDKWYDSMCCDMLDEFDELKEGIMDET
ncbi:hypothetical protein NVP1170O_177 [Vibrio phage 1.170.O._10N.261.52.C3]|nr:hypothetical protein NVP1170O_177 [Vibrio phage 1.170.O._10N.261.52.C3]